MNSERPDNPENPDAGAEPDATEEIRAAGDDVTEADVTAAASGSDAEGGAAPEGDADERPVSDGDGDGDGHGDHVVEVGGADRPRRRHSRVAVASVAAAVLLVGGGGAYFATTASGGSGGGSSSPGGDGTPPPLALDGYTEGGSNGIAPGEPDPNGVTYRADGDLPDGPDSAPVYSVEGEVTRAEVVRLAKALGVEGTPTAEGDAWRVGGVRDGSGPGLQVTKQSPGAWTFSRYAPGTDNCQKVDVCASDSAAGSGDPVSAAAAKKAAAPVLKAVGQDDAKLDAAQLMGAVRVVNADPEVGGLPTYGWATGIQVGADGQVVGGSGNLKAPVKSDTYPVVNAERALELMNDSGRGVGTAREGIGGCASPAPLEGGSEADATEGTEGTAETPCELTTTAPKPEAVTVEDAVFGLASHHVDGRPALVPSWMFEVRPKGAEDSFTVTHPAIDPRYLATPDQPSEPSDEPTEEPVDPGDQPTGRESRDVQVQGYTVDGGELTVTFWGGVCSDYSASATEDAGKVTVTVTDTPWEGKVCIMIAKTVERTVELDRPLGDRKVVGSDGRTIQEGGSAELEPQ